MGSLENLWSNLRQRSMMLEVGLVVMALIIRTGWLGFPDASYGVLAALALMGRRQALVALFLSWFFTMLNYFLFPWLPYGFIGRFLVIGAAAVSVLAAARHDWKQLWHPFSVATLLVGFYAAIHALFISPYPLVSLLKLGAWIATVFSLFHAWYGLESPRRRQVADLLYWCLTAIAVASVFYVGKPPGYELNRFGFQGVLNHPNGFGITMALLGAWSFGRVLESKRLAVFSAGVLVLVVWMILLSKSRTAGLALLLGSVGAVISAMLFQRKPWSERFPAFSSLPFRVLMALLIFGAILSFQTIREQVNLYLSKSARADVVGVIDAYQRSRAVLYEPILENIGKTPWSGIGFGIGSQPEQMKIKRDPWFDLPIAASVEKGNVLLGTLEELGIVGFGIVLIWLGIGYRHAIQGGVCLLSLFLTVLSVNLGEAVLFSPGGMGMLFLIGFTFGIAGAARPPNRIAPQPGKTVLYFWQQIVSPHMAALADALAQRGYEVVYVVQREMSSERAYQGWVPHTLRYARLIIASDRRSVLEVAHQAPAGSVHLTQGLRGNGLVHTAQVALARRTMNQWVIMESVDDAGFRGVLKREAYRQLFRWWESEIQGVLAIGKDATDWVLQRGVSSKRVFPFSYFLEIPAFSQEREMNEERPFQVLYLGRHIPLKQVDVLIRALAMCKDRSFEFIFGGDGPCREKWENLAEELLPGRYRMLGRVPMQDAPGHILTADCLVLPSRYDGWGVVVTEALLAGTPVVCSNGCGAAEAVEASGEGGVFPSGNEHALATMLHGLMGKGPSAPAQRGRLARWAASSFSAEIGAEYLNEILQHSNHSTAAVIPPWKPRELVNSEAANHG